MKLNPAGITATLNSKDGLKLLNQEAEAIKREVDAALAPHRRTGNTQASIHRRVARPGPTGPTASVYSDAWWFHFIEWGTARQTPIAPIRRAVARRRLTLRTVER